MPTPLQKKMHGHFIGSDLTDELRLLHTSFVLLTLTRSPFVSTLSFQIVRFFFIVR